MARHHAGQLREKNRGNIARRQVDAMAAGFVGPQRKAWEVVRGHVIGERPKTALTTITLPWGRGVGKTFWQQQIACAITARWDGVQRDALRPFRGVRIAWYMDTQKHWKSIHAALLDRQLGKGGFWECLGGKINRSTWTVTFPGGSVWELFASAPSHAQAARGFRADVAIGDEIDDTERNVFEAVAVPWFTEPWSFKLRIQGGTPRRGQRGLLYHLHKLGLSSEHADYHSFHATWRDVPEIVDEAVRLDAYNNRISDAVYAREWECDFKTGEGLVYDIWDSAFHVKPAPDGMRFNRLIAGKDWGYSDPGSLGVWGILGHGRDATAWRIAEVYERGQPNSWWDKKIQKHAQHAQVLYCDPSRPDRISGLQDLGINAVGAPNSIDEGIMTMADMMFLRPDPQHPANDTMRKPRLFVDPGCRAFIGEVERYRRKPHPFIPDEYLETPEDKDNHAMDESRYALHGEFGRIPGYREERAAW